MTSNPGGPPDPADITEATVPLARLMPERVPPLCVKTGLKAQCVVATTATTTPKWAWLLILLGGWPLFAARRWLFARQVLLLPTRNYVADRWGWVQKGLIGCFTVAGVVLVAGAATLNLSGVVGAWLLAVVATGVWLLLVPRYWVGAELDGTTVHLTGIHRTAANALTR